MARIPPGAGGAGGRHVPADGNLPCRDCPFLLPGLCPALAYNTGRNHPITEVTIQMKTAIASARSQPMV